MRTIIEAGATIETTTPNETRQIMRTTAEQLVGKLAGSITHMDVSTSTIDLAPGASQPLRIGADPVGPRPGRAWGVCGIYVYGGVVDSAAGWDTGQPAATRSPASLRAIPPK